MSKATGYINYNGRFFSAGEPVLQADNRAFRYGWGLFETMLVRNGVIRLASHHWARLMSGAQLAGLHLPKLMTADFLEKEVLRTVQKNRLETLARVRLQFYNGEGGLWDRNIQKAGFIIECFPLEEHVTQLNDAGVTTGIAAGMYKSADSFSNLKTSGAFIYAMAAEMAKRKGWNDALILNPASNIIESTIANIFWVQEGIIYTPPLREGCVAGIMRRHLLEVLPDHGYRIGERTLTRNALNQADSVFLTNAIRGIRWVRDIDNQTFDTGYAAELWRLLA